VLVVAAGLVLGTLASPARRPAGKTEAAGGPSGGPDRADSSPVPQREFKPAMESAGRAAPHPRAGDGGEVSRCVAQLSELHVAALRGRLDANAYRRSLLALAKELDGDPGLATGLLAFLSTGDAPAGDAASQGLRAILGSLVEVRDGAQEADIGTPGTRVDRGLAQLLIYACGLCERREVREVLVGVVRSPVEGAPSFLVADAVAALGQPRSGDFLPSGAVQLGSIRPPIVYAGALVSARRLEEDTEVPAVLTALRRAREGGDAATVDAALTCLLQSGGSVPVREAVQAAVQDLPGAVASIHAPDAWTMGILRLAAQVGADGRLDSDLGAVVAAGTNESVVSLAVATLGRRNPAGLLDSLAEREGRRALDGAGPLASATLQAIPVEKYCEDEALRRRLVDWLVAQADREGSRLSSWSVASALSRAMSTEFHGPEVEALLRAVSRFNADEGTATETTETSVAMAGGGTAQVSTVMEVDSSSVPIVKRVTDLLIGRIAVAGRANPDTTDRWAGLLSRLWAIGGGEPAIRDSMVRTLEAVRPPETGGMMALVEALANGTPGDEGLRRRLAVAFSWSRAAREGFLAIRGRFEGADPQAWVECCDGAVMEECASRLGVPAERLVRDLRGLLRVGRLLSVDAQSDRTAVVTLLEEGGSIVEVGIELREDVWRVCDAAVRRLDLGQVAHRNSGGPVRWTLRPRTDASARDGFAVSFTAVSQAGAYASWSPEMVWEKCGWFHTGVGVAARAVGYGSLERHDAVPAGTGGWTTDPFLPRDGSVWVFRVRRPLHHEYFVVARFARMVEGEMEIEWELLRASDGAPERIRTPQPVLSPTPIDIPAPCGRSHGGIPGR